MIHTELIAPIGDLLDRHRIQRGEKVAYEDARSSVTYAALDTETARLAGYFQSIGVQPGDRVAILLPNSTEWAISCLACARAGAIAVPISHDSALPEIEYRLVDSKCSVVVTSDRRASDVSMIADSAKIPVALVTAHWSDQQGSDVSFADVVSRDHGVAPLDPSDIDAPAYIIYTSGTTGKPKGVLLSLRSMLWVVAACWVPVAGLSQDDRVLSCLPLYHSYAVNLSILSIVATGASIYLMERYSTSEIPILLQSRSFTIMPGVPAMFQYLLSAAREHKGAVGLPGLRLCISAGAIMPEVTNREFEETFGIRLLDGYGITETATMVTMNWPTGTRVYGSCGLPLPGLSVRILNPGTGRDVDLGEEGELIVRGPNVMKGYLNLPSATDAVLKDGWYYTGDLARSDAAGYLTITGRLKEIIIRGAQNISPAEIEDVALTFEGVHDCAVAAKPHPHLGEVPVLFVVERSPGAVDTKALLEHCRHHLSTYKIPDEIRLISEIPRTGSGKVMRFKLAAAA